MLMIGANEFSDPGRNTFGLVIPGTLGQRLLHITLYGPFTLRDGDNPEHVLNNIESAAQQSGTLHYRISGLLRLRGRKGAAIALRVNPSSDLEGYYCNLSASLLPLLGKGTWIDRRPGLRQLHITLALNLKTAEADMIWERIAGEHAMQSVPGTYESAGIAVFRNGALWREYDLVGMCWRNRAEIFEIRRRERAR